MSYRVALEVRWKADRDLWAVEKSGVEGVVVLAYAPTKAEAINRGAAEGRVLSKRGLLVELTIYRKKDSRIGKGHSGRRTYGADPEASKG